MDFPDGQGYVIFCDKLKKKCDLMVEMLKVCLDSHAVPGNQGVAYTIIALGLAEWEMDV